MTDTIDSTHTNSSQKTNNIAFNIALEFLGEVISHLFVPLLLGTAIGLYFFIGFWCVVGIIPMVLLGYYLTK